jgi:hypothetical protein
MPTEIIKIGPKGRIDLPMWAWKALLRMSKVRSKKFRIQKKAVKKQFSKVVRESMKE